MTFSSAGDSHSNDQRIPWFYGIQKSYFRVCVLYLDHTNYRKPLLVYTICFRLQSCDGKRAKWAFWIRCVKSDCQIAPRIDSSQHFSHMPILTAALTIVSVTFDVREVSGIWAPPILYWQSIYHQWRRFEPNPKPSEYQTCTLEVPPLVWWLPFDPNRRHKSWNVGNILSEYWQPVTRGRE
jgi:hypothetical protein